MRTGAIFARGSCRALKWTALLGVVLALGAAQAAAQQVLTIRDVTVVNRENLLEGRTATVRVRVDAPRTIAANGTDAVVIELVSNPALREIDTGEDIEFEDITFLGLANSSHAAATPAIRATKEVRYTTRSVRSVIDVTFELEIRHDDDAEDEKFYVEAWVVDAVGAPAERADGVEFVTTHPRFLATIHDDDPQEYRVHFYRHSDSTNESEVDLSSADLTRITNGIVSEGEQNIRVVLRPEPARTIPLFYSVLVNGRSRTEFVDVQAPATEGATVDADRTGSWALLDFFENDGNRVDEEEAEVTVLWRHERATSRSMGEESASLRVRDNHILPVPTVTDARDEEVGGDEASSVTEGGDSVWLTVEVKRTTGTGSSARDLTSEALTIDLAPVTQGTSYRLVPNRLEFDAATVTDTKVVELKALEDDWVGDDEFGLNMTVTGDEDRYGEGEANGTYTLTVVDTTMKLIEPETDENVKQAVDDAIAAAQDDEDGLNPNESFSVSVDRLFTGIAPGATVNYSARVDDGVAATVSTSGTMVTVNAVQEGTATVVVTAVVDTPSSAITQTVNDTAQVPFTVTVVNKPLRVELTADPPDAVMEGGTIRLIAAAKRAVLADDDATVSLKVTGSIEGTAPTEITIPVGQMMSDGVELMVKNDDQVMAMDPVVVVGSGGGLATDPTVLSIAVTEDDEPPVAEPTVTAKSDADVAAAVAAAIDERRNEAGLWLPGSQVNVLVSELFDFADGAELSSINFMSSDYNVAGGWEYVDTEDQMYSNVTISPSGAGTATITITVAATMAGSDVANVATVEFDVTVDELPLVVTGVTAEPMEVMEGAMTTITATTNRETDEAVMLTLDVVGDEDAYMVADMLEIPAGVTSGSVELTASQDDDYMDESLTVIVTGPGIDGAMRVEIAVTDDDEAPVDQSTVRAKDGAAEMIAAAIAKAAGDADWMVGGMVATVDMSELFEVDEGVTASYSGMSSNEDVVKSMTTGATMLALTPMGAGSATITVTASDQAGGGVDTVTHATMVALQTLMVEVTASAHMVDEGGSVTLTAEANRMVTADTVLTLTVTGDTDAVEAPESLTIAMGADMGTAMVMAMEDADTADEMVTVVVTGPGIASPVSIEIGVTDNDRTVVAKSQEQVTAVFVTAVMAASGPDGWLPGGDAAMVDMSELFTIDEGATVEYMAESSAEDMVMASASGSMLTLTPMATGSATITVTATDTSGDADDHAMIMADVEVGVLPLMVELHGPADMNLVEGMSYEITAMANRAVTEDTTVEIMRDRAASDAGEDDYSVENITIAAGADSGTTMLMVTEDNMPDSGTNDNQSEMLVLYGMVGNMQTNSLSFYIWDAAVPALPVIAQLLLAAFLAFGGYRRYRRR